MRPSSTELLRRRIGLWLAGVLMAGAAAAQSIGAAPGRFVDFVELTDHDDQADIVVQFNCALRYLTHLPVSEGAELRVQLLPQAGCNVDPSSQVAGELPPVSGGGNILTAVRVDADVPGQLTLVFVFRKAEQFVLVQGATARDLRLRLINRARGRGKIMVGDALDSVSNFAVNLESQPKPFDSAAVALAESRFKTPAYVSQATVDGQTWYRLRLGPIDKRDVAERLLNAAAGEYPRAWLAIGDDAITTGAGASDDDGPLPAVERGGSDAALDEGARQRLWNDARTAMAARNFAAAIGALTKLQRQPEYPGRAAAQELLGLARERSGQLAHAKAEYVEYLRRYPKGEAADRVARRLNVLRLTSASAATGSRGNANPAWNISGGFGQQYRYDGTRVASSSVDSLGTTLPAAAQTTSQNALYNDVDLLARHRGERLDFVSRISAGYAKNFSNSVVGGSRRISIASAELVDRSLGLLVRVGRQSRSDDGVLGTFDGLFASFQVRPYLSVNSAVGFPVEQTTAGLVTGRRFETLALDLTPPGSHFSASVFGAVQTYEGLTDRRAVGLEARFLAPRMALTGLVDYDVAFHSLNAAALLGTLQLPARWNVSFDAEKRNSPVLTLRNALIGQPVPTIIELEQVFTVPEITQLARDRTAATSNYSVTVSRPLGQRFQFASTLAAGTTDGTVASGGVPAQPGTGTNLIYQAQIYGSSLWRSGDFNVVSFSYARTDIGKTLSLGVTSREPLRGAWRLGPRLSVDRRTLATDGSTELNFVPSLLLDYQRGRRLLQFEAGGQTGKRDAVLQSQHLSRYYVSLAYRIGF